MQLETVIYEKEENVALIKLNRPQVLNAENIQLVIDLVAALREAGNDPEVKAVMMKGEGRAFCAGADLKEFAAPKPDEVRIPHGKREQDICALMRDIRKPVVGAVHGYAVGFGFELALACDVRIVAEGTRFRFTEATLGATVTTGGLWMLPRIVGLGKAKELVLGADWVDAQEAYRIGLANKVVPADKLDQEAMEMARRMASNYFISNWLMKAIMDEALESNLDTVLHLEELANHICDMGETQAEGMVARMDEMSKKKK